ncbi:leukocyte surface antigen CD53 [Brachyhypopomus gauderio]|uniref:leukocyte surface antigen CD53 n=1 Tax=Brachyhypopomus gauderio TaxID=698409 RepID=UPI004041724C
MSCLKCLKYTMCVVNFIFFICGTAIFGFGIYLSMTSRYASLIPSLKSMTFANSLFIIGIFVTCVSFLGFLGALKENRCLLISFFTLLFLLMMAELVVACLLLMYEREMNTYVEKELKASVDTARYKTSNSTDLQEWDAIQRTFECCGVNSSNDWNGRVPDSCCKSSSSPCKIEEPTSYWKDGCYDKLKTWFDSNLLSTGIGVICVCSIEVLGMCFSMTLFCHISKSGLGYK